MKCFFIPIISKPYLLYYPYHKRRDAQLHAQFFNAVLIRAIPITVETILIQVAELIFPIKRFTEMLLFSVNLSSSEAGTSESSVLFTPYTVNVRWIRHRPSTNVLTTSSVSNITLTSDISDNCDSMIAWSSVVLNLTSTRTMSEYVRNFTWNHATAVIFNTKWTKSNPSTTVKLDWLRCVKLKIQSYITFTDPESDSRIWRIKISFVRNHCLILRE